jgi:hypothetical protein
VCGEGFDRPDIRLPGLQLNLTLAVLATGKPVVIVLINGGVLGLEDITALPGPMAIVEAFYPGESGGVPIAMALFGQANRWGKLPLTFYPTDITQQLVSGNMSMTAAPGRTYKFYTGPAVFPFGAGLSYTTFALSAADAGEAARTVTVPSPSAAAQLRAVFTVNVANTGDVTGDEVRRMATNGMGRKGGGRNTAADPPPPPLGIRWCCCLRTRNSVRRRHRWRTLCRAATTRWRSRC